MIRSGMIKMESSGIYTWLPLGFKVLEKIKKIIEKEHELCEVNQFLMPTIQSSEIWKKSGRYDSYGKEMLRITDRHNKDLLYGPTNEEMVTSIGSDLIKTWTLVFPSEENYNEFLGESVRLTYYNDMQLYNEQNGISDSIDIQDV